MKNIVKVDFRKEGLVIAYNQYDFDVQIMQRMGDYDVQDGIRLEHDVLNIPDKASIYYHLSKWIYSKIQEGVYGELTKLSPQYQFTTLMNQANKASGNCFEFKGRNSLSSLWKLDS